MKEILESKECKDYVQARNATKYAEITLANTEMSGNPIATELAQTEYNKSQERLESARQLLSNKVITYIDTLT